MKPDRRLKAQIAILHGIMTKPGITLSQINEEHGEHASFMEDMLGELTQMRLIKLESSLPWAKRKSLAVSQNIIIEHGKIRKTAKRYSLPLILEQIIRDYEHYLTEAGDE